MSYSHAYTEALLSALQIDCGGVTEVTIKWTLPPVVIVVSEHEIDGERLQAAVEWANYEASRA